MKRTGQVVADGQYREGSSLSLYLFSVHGKHITSDKFNNSCQHSPGGLLCVEIAGKEYLAISCPKCRNIKLLDLQTGQVTGVFWGKILRRMCQGEGGTLYVESAEDEVLELYCTLPVFTKTKTMNTEIESNSKYRGMCYVSSPYRYIVVTNGDKIVSTACDTNTRVWKVKQGFPLKSIDPHGMLYSQRHHSILVADGKKSRILVLNPSNGDTTQEITLSGMGNIISLCINNNQLVVKHISGIFNKAKMSFFSVN